MELSQLLHHSIPEESKCKDSKSDLSYIKNFAKIFEGLDQSLQKIAQIANKWLFSAKWVVVPEEFKNKKSLYVHYRNKIKKLMKEIEQLRKKKKGVSEKKFKRLERVSLRVFNLFF